MLPRRARLRTSREFSRVVAEGRRAGRRRLVVHLLVPTTADEAGPAGPASSTAGFVVSSAVGGSVTRHAVARRLRPLVAARLSTLPPGSQMVVRALPAAAHAPSRDLGEDLDGALAKLGHRPVGVDS